MTVKVYQLRGQIVWSESIVPPTPSGKVNQVEHLVAFSDQAGRSNSYSTQQLVAFDDSAGSIKAYEAQQLVARVTFIFGDIKCWTTQQLSGNVQQSPEPSYVAFDNIRRTTVFPKVLGDPNTFLAAQTHHGSTKAMVMRSQRANPASILPEYADYGLFKAVIEKKVGEDPARILAAINLNFVGISRVLVNQKTDPRVISSEQKAQAITRSIVSVAQREDPGTIHAGLHSLGTNKEVVVRNPKPNPASIRSDVREFGIAKALLMKSVKSDPSTIASTHLLRGVVKTRVLRADKDDPNQVFSSTKFVSGIRSVITDGGTRVDPSTIRSDCTGHSIVAAKVLPKELFNPSDLLGTPALLYGVYRTTLFSKNLPEPGAESVLCQHNLNKVLAGWR